MANQRVDTKAVIDLVINGKQAMTTFGELTTAQKKLNAEVKNMKPEDPGYNEQLRQLNLLNTAVREQRDLLNGVNKDTDELKQHWTEIAAGVAAGNFITNFLESAQGAIEEFISGSTAAYGEAEQGQAQLQAALKSTGGAVGQTKDQLDAMAGSLMTLTGVDDDVITKSEALLLTFTNVRGTIYEQALPAIVDMTAAMNNGNVSMETIQGTTIQVGKALNDPIKGMTALSKVGVSFTAEQKETVKTLVATGKTAEAQALILNELGKEFGGVAESMARTDTGAAMAFQTRMGNIQEVVGGFITKMKAATIEGLNPFITNVERWISQPLAEKIQEEQSELNGLVSAIVMTNDNQAVRNTLIGELQAKYPDFLGKINAETASNELLTRRLTEVNDQYRQRIYIAANEDRIREIQDKRNEAIRLEAKARMDVAKASGLSATALAKLTDEEIRAMAAQLRAKALQADRLRGSSGGNAYSSGTSNTNNKETGDLDLIVNGRKRIAASFREEADLMGANQIMQSKVTAERIKNIDLEIAKLKQLKSQSAKADIERLKAEKNALMGVVARTAPTSAPGPTKAEVSAADKLKKQLSDLDEEYKKLGVQQLNDQLSKNQKELEVEGQKYDALIKKEQDFLQQKGVTADQRNKVEARITQIGLDKQAAQNVIAVRQEQEMTTHIADLRDKLAVKRETELSKESDIINKFYDDQERDYAGNADAIAVLQVARSVELSDAELREKKRLEAEKLRIERDGAALSGNSHAIRLAEIKKQYDEELEALKKKFGDQLMATEEGLAAIAAVENNRKAAIAKENTSGTDKSAKDKAKEEKDAALQSAQAVSDATFSIMAQNRQRETDLKLSAIEKERTSELANKKLSDKQKEEINKKYDAKVKAEKLKAWQAEKQAALTQAVINGALAVTKALPNVPLAIATGIAAAAQIAVIVASKPPEFATGVRKFKGGPAIVGEKGTEIVNENGNVWVTDGPTLAELAPGTDVFNADETKTMMKGKSLGERMYPQSNYIIDTTASRSAERNYRSSGSAAATQSSTGSAAATSTATSTGNEEMLYLMRQMIEAQREANDKQVAFVYSEWEIFKNNVEAVRITQGAG
jgi:hypothetical protein